MIRAVSGASTQATHVDAIITSEGPKAAVVLNNEPRSGEFRQRAVIYEAAI